MEKDSNLPCCLHHSCLVLLCPNNSSCCCYSYELFMFNLYTLLLDAHSLARRRVVRITLFFLCHTHESPLSPIASYNKRKTKFSHDSRKFDGQKNSFV